MPGVSQASMCVCEYRKTRDKGLARERRNCGLHTEKTRVIPSTSKSIKISHISRGHCAGCSRDREVRAVPCGWLASTVFSTHDVLDRQTSGLCCWGVLWEQPFGDSEAESIPYTLRARSKCPCDFFLWWYLKGKVFKHRPRSLEDLKERIRQEIDSILPELTRNFRESLQQCVANGGHHMSDIILKTH